MISALQNLTHVTSVTDVIRDIFEQKRMGRVERSREDAKNVHDRIGACLHMTYKAE